MSELKLEHGAPSDLSGRLPKEIKSYQRLDALHVSYDRIDHEAAETMELCAEIDKVLGCAICKNLLLEHWLTIIILN